MTDERIIAYLLEELPEEELEQFEDECFAAESWPQQLSLVEEDLIDAYLRQELSKERRERFERNYLKTEARRERLHVAAALLRHVDERTAQEDKVSKMPPAVEARSRPSPSLWSSQGWALRAAAVVAVVAIIAGAVWLISRSQSSKTYSTLTLAISYSNRADSTQAGKVKLPLKADALRIFLTLPEQAQMARAFQAELERDNGETSPLEIKERQAQSVTVEIPAGQLLRGLYALKLFAVKDDGTRERINGSYFFAVE